MEHRAKWGGGADENNVVFPSVGQKTSTAHELQSCSSTTRPLVGGVFCMMQQQTLLEGITGILHADQLASLQSIDSLSQRL